MGFLKKLRGVADKVIPRPGGDPGGVPARGVVVEVVQAPWGERDDWSEHSLWSAVTLRLRRADQPDGPVTTAKVYMKSAGWRAIEAGQDVPVRVDAQTGVLLNIDAAAYEDEVEAGNFKPPEITPDSFLGHGEPSAESLDAIEGVTLELWATTLAGIAKGMVAPAQQDAFAAARGVPAGRWADICAAWQQRANTDWKVGMRFGETFQSAMQNG